MNRFPRPYTRMLATLLATTFFILSPMEPAQAKNFMGLTDRVAVAFFDKLGVSDKRYL